MLLDRAELGYAARRSPVAVSRTVTAEVRGNRPGRGRQVAKWCSVRLMRRSVIGSYTFGVDITVVGNVITGSAKSKKNILKRIKSY